ncbi:MULTISPECIES: mandelate racemase/muconate lactonizing enzyme family protein [Prauserella salsuginis group]|uniref:Mandelate racemase/muconate lactonizing enzyme family protein n=1 Tax=Prauserella salsuginis TaxID=387889 RepID=A0ABW6G1P4_9PSEU|nr:MULTISPECIES: mandelate racemase/muconate lactonizing enzyme family protein [Prauserella salsuginis group]MCR3722272.1 L-alanine-DL-glutamate epimerase [Prauserella flava]MCR3736270.1 L-alanine-DL-glutamate epimerase [Prauserella salsuginis]
MSAAAGIAELRCASTRLPLPGTWDGGVSFHDVVVARLRDAGGAEGTGFSWTPRVGASAVRALLEDECADFLREAGTHPISVWEALYARLHEAGPGGIAAMAQAAVDIGLWDLRARVAGTSLVDLLGRRREIVPAYASGVNLDYSLDELQAQVSRWVEAGHTAVKIKVGSAELDRDLERVAAVRELIGPHAKLMVDANQRWDVPTASRAVNALERFDPYWIEEPLPADDLAGHVRLRSTTRVPFAVGENLRTVRQFRDMLAVGVCDIAQPNVVRVGGITPFLRIAELAAAYDVPVAPHLLPEMSAQLALCVPVVSMVEAIDRASLQELGGLAEPSGVTVDAAGARADTGPGHGLVFDV